MGNWYNGAAKAIEKYRAGPLTKFSSDFSHIPTVWYVPPDKAEAMGLKRYDLNHVSLYDPKDQTLQGMYTSQNDVYYKNKSELTAVLIDSKTRFDGTRGKQYFVFFGEVRKVEPTALPFLHRVNEDGYTNEHLPEILKHLQTLATRKIKSISGLPDDYNT